MPSLETVVFTRQGCCLCDEAIQLLAAHGLQPTLVDIDLQPELAERYGTCVPVVCIAGRERFRGKVDPRLLKRLLVGQSAFTPAQDATPE